MWVRNEKGLFIFWQEYIFLLARNTGITQSRHPARTSFSSQVLVLPAEERFSFKVYVFSKECLILVKGKQNNTLHFYHLHKLLFQKTHGIELL